MLSRFLYYNNLSRRLAFGLPRELWVVEIGIFLNYVGWGSVLPFEVIYLPTAAASGSGRQA
jgi:hypothetical protein